MRGADSCGQVSQIVNSVSRRRPRSSAGGSYAFDGTASGTPYRPNSRQVDKRLSFLVQRPVERHRQGTGGAQSTPMGAKPVVIRVETVGAVGDPPTGSGS